MTDSANQSKPVLTFEGVKYSINDLPEQAQKLIEGMKVAEGQLKLQGDNIKVLEVGRQSMALQLKELLKNETPLEE
tara:strand:+ start:1751 stop:1978 length:228 start_codon:yes stop_codon:yes gene_type:complete